MLSYSLNNENYHIHIMNVNLWRVYRVLVEKAPIEVIGRGRRVDMWDKSGSEIFLTRAHSQISGRVNLHSVSRPRRSTPKKSQATTQRSASLSFFLSD